jgi:hypothetical protein
VEVGGLFGIESIHGGRGVHTDRDLPAAGQVESAQAHRVVRFTETVDALPDSFQRPRIHRRLKRPPGHVLQKLATRSDTHLRPEQLLKFCIHDEERQPPVDAAIDRLVDLWTDSGLWTIAPVESPPNARGYRRVGVQTRPLAESRP